MIVNSRVGQTLNTRVKMRSTRVRTRTAPMYSTGPCQAAGNTAFIQLTAVPGWCSSTSSTSSGISSGTGTADRAPRIAMMLAATSSRRCAAIIWITSDHV